MELREPGMLAQHDVVDRIAEDVGERPPQFRRHTVARAHRVQAGWSGAAALRARLFEPAVLAAVFAVALAFTVRGAAFVFAFALRRAGFLASLPSMVRSASAGAMA